MKLRHLLIAGASLMMGGCLDRQYVYAPSKWQQADWKALSGLPLEDVWFRASDGVRLHGWLVEAAGSPAILLWCHGNAGNITHRLQNITSLHRRGLSVFIFDYRGYGQSEGAPSERGLYADAHAAYALLTKERNIPLEKIIIFGRSLGAAVATELARGHKAAGLILESPFPSIEAMARTHYGGLPLHLLLQARFPLIERIKEVSVPILVLHGDQDDIVPLALGQAVYEAAPQPKRFYLIKGANHNDTDVVGGDPYFDRLLSFIRDCLRQKSADAPSGT